MRAYASIHRYMHSVYRISLYNLDERLKCAPLGHSHPHQQSVLPLLQALSPSQAKCGPIASGHSHPHKQSEVQGTLSLTSKVCSPCFRHSHPHKQSVLPLLQGTRTLTNKVWSPCFRALSPSQAKCEYVI